MITLREDRNLLEGDEDLNRYEQARLNLLERAALSQGLSPARGAVQTPTGLRDLLTLRVDLGGPAEGRRTPAERLRALLADLGRRGLPWPEISCDTPHERRFLDSLRDPSGDGNRPPTPTTVLMFAGGYEEPEPGLDFFLQPVAFPMDVFNPRHGDADDSGEPERLVLHDPAQLEAWAEEAFFAHDVWEMEVPASADASADPGAGVNRGEGVAGCEPS